MFGFLETKSDDPVANDADGEILAGAAADVGRGASQLEKAPIEREDRSVFGIGNFVPIQLRFEEGFFVLRIGNLFGGAGFVDGFEEIFEFATAALGDEFSEFVVMIGEIKKRSGGGPFLSHEEERNAGRQAKQGGSGAIGFGGNEMIEPFAERAISDLIVIGDAVDELVDAKMSEIGRAHV